MSIKTKLFLTFAVIAAIATVNSIGVLRYLDSFMANAQTILATQQVKDSLSYAVTLDTSFTDITATYARGSDPVLKSYYAARLSMYHDLVSRIQTLDLTPTGKMEFDRILTARQELFDIETQVFALADAGNRAAAVTLFSSDAYLANKSVVSEIIDAAKGQTDERIAAFEASRAEIVKASKYFSEFTIAGLVFFGLMLIFLVTSTVSRTLRDIAATAEAIGRGETGRRVVVPPKDRELARTAVAFNKMAIAVDERGMRERLEKITDAIRQ